MHTHTWLVMSFWFVSTSETQLVSWAFGLFPRPKLNFSFTLDTLNHSPKSAFSLGQNILREVAFLTCRLVQLAGLLGWVRAAKISLGECWWLVAKFWQHLFNLLQSSIFLQNKPKIDNYHYLWKLYISFASFHGNQHKIKDKKASKRF